MAEHKVTLTACDEHEMGPTGYLAWHADAEIRSKRGERQVVCDECGLWSWPRLAAPTVEEKP